MTDYTHKCPLKHPPDDLQECYFIYEGELLSGYYNEDDFYAVYDTGIIIIEAVDVDAWFEYTKHLDPINMRIK